MMDMKRKFRFIPKRIREYMVQSSGVSTVEYALIVLAVIGIVGVGIGVLGGAFNNLFDDLEAELSVVASKATPG